jgi:dTDP-4-dehydrorhamnose reductase
MIKNKLMKILVTGAGGQLGQELFRCFKIDNFEIIPVTKIQMDVTNYAEVNRIVKYHKPDWIVNCAAYTNVDLAEQNVDKSFEVNTIGPRVLAQASENTETRLLHISTDSVFSSPEPIFFQANSEPNPINQYGRSKEGGEKILLKNYFKNSWIIRTSWLYGEFGGKFMGNVLSAIRKNLPLQIVDDQFGQPTNTKDLAIHIKRFILEPPVANVYHFADYGFTSRYDFANEIVQFLNPSRIKISRSTTLIDTNTAIRPRYSLLSLGSESVAFDTEFVPWQKSLHQFLKTQESFK